MSGGKRGKNESKKKDEDDKASKRIISLTMSEPIVDRIDDLVQDRVARSRAQLIEDAVRWFLDFTVHRWTERGIYFNEIRMTLEPETLSSLYFSKLTPPMQYELGQTAGSQAPFTDIIKLNYGTDPYAEENREMLLDLLQNAGWGLVRIQNDMIIIGSPFYPAPFIRGYLESLLKVELELVETSAKENVALRIKG